MSGGLSDGETATEVEDDQRDWVEFVHFQLGDDAYELELGRVKQITRNPAITQVPQTGASIAGVTNLGGDIVVVIDGRALFDLPSRSPDADTVLLLLDRGTAQPTGLLVDDVSGIDPHHVDGIQSPAEFDAWTPPIDERWFRAIIEETDRTGRPVGIIDFDLIIEEARKQA